MRLQVLLTSLCLLFFSVVNAQTPGIASKRIDNNPGLRARLTGFTGTEKTNRVSLSWTTAGEQYSSHFIVEHSTDGLEFDSIGAVTAVGRFQLPTSYRFEDLQPYHGSHFYRVRIKDLDGKDSYGKIFRIETRGEASSLDRSIRIKANYGLSAW